MESESENNPVEIFIDFHIFIFDYAVSSSTDTAAVEKPELVPVDFMHNNWKQ